MAICFSPTTCRLPLTSTVNRHRQRAAKGIAGIGPALSVERVTTGGFDIGTSVTKQPLQIARHSIKAKISFTVTAGIRRGAFAGADVLLQHDGQRIANIAWSTIFKQRLIAIVNRLSRLENRTVGDGRRTGNRLCTGRPCTSGVEGIRAQPVSESTNKLEMA